MNGIRYRRASGSPRVALFALMVIIAGAANARADLPVRHEELVYSLVVFNGRDYGGTFVRQSANTVYLLAGTDNFVSARKTLVYYWPITASYRLDTDSLNRPVEGTLRIRGNGIDLSLSPEEYTYYNLHGPYDLNWEVSRGDDARRVYAQYQSAVAAYQAGQLEYQRALSDYEERANALGTRIIRLTTQGTDASSLVSELKSLTAPSEPPPMVTPYAVPPSAPGSAFNINLKPGSYRMELVLPNGRTEEGSEKRLVVFAENAANRVGYDVIPGDKWTRPEVSSVPASVLYVDGSTDLYLRPFFETEYNSLEYEKLINNDAQGNRNATEWVKLQQVPRAKVLVNTAGKIQAVSENGFQVQQIQGASLGYTIVPFTRSTDIEATPDIVAYHIPIDPASPVIRVSGEDENGAALAGSVREIRIVAGPGPEAVLLVLALAPLAIMGFVLAARFRRLNQEI